VIDNWEKEIYIAHLVRQKLGEVDTTGLWFPHSFPEVAAPEDRLEAAEASLGYSIDSQYRAFLSRADGWKGFFHRIDLFGTLELMGSPHMDKALELLDSLEPIERLCEVTRSGLLPIAVSRDSIDVFAIARSGGPKAGHVLWFAGGLIEEYADFSEFFLAMVDYNRREIRQLQYQQDAAM
jgi:SMI1 / KNR4 family (SUKH-1)